jgi:hypothetical protein
LPLAQLGQLGDVGGDPPHLIVAQELGWGAPVFLLS